MLVIVGDCCSWKKERLMFDSTPSKDVWLKKFRTEVRKSCYRQSQILLRLFNSRIDNWLHRLINYIMIGILRRDEMVYWKMKRVYIRVVPWLWLARKPSRPCSCASHFSRMCMLGLAALAYHLPFAGPACWVKSSITPAQNILDGLVSNWRQISFLSCLSSEPPKFLCATARGFRGSFVILLCDHADKPIHASVVDNHSVGFAL
jgi:hypothetical protein